MKKLLVLLLTVFALNSCEQDPEIIGVDAEKKQLKVDVCHYDADTDTWKTISINGNALKAHLKHGDYEGECGMPEIGDTYEGGIVFYILQPDDIHYIEGETHGLIVAPSDLGYTGWGCDGSDLSSPNVHDANDLPSTEPGARLGDGLSNTNIIVNECRTIGIAADLAVNYRGGGYADWYLPSLTELYFVHRNLIYDPNHDPDGKPAIFFWSSSEGSATTAILYDFNFGHGGYLGKFVDYRSKVLPIRQF